jgi:hypothetical protein
VYFAGIMTERGEDETALMLLKDLDFRLTMLRNLYVPALAPRSIV